MVDGTLLLDKITAALLAAAIGDAMGGPIEGWHYEQITATHGVVTGLLPYRTEPGYHNHFSRAAGAVTDDTRLRHLLCEAIIAAGRPPRRGDLVRAIVAAYAAAEDDLQRGFLEEYALGGLYGDSKLIWGGQSTNGFLMANAPLGLICPCDPEAAFALSYEVDFISGGYARYTAALAAAAVAAAMRPGATPASVIEEALRACQTHRVEGPLTRQWSWYDHVFRLNERLIETAVEIALRYGDVLAVRAPFYDVLRLGPLGSEAGQTLAVALGMLVAAHGDVRQTLIGCVNYGRDNDSYASVAGAIAGALNGLSDIPHEWSQTLSQANPACDMGRLASGLAQVATARCAHLKSVVLAVDDLLSPLGA